MEWIDRVRALKAKGSYTNELLAEKSGIPIGTLNKLLAGATEGPKLSTVILIAKALDCSLDYIINGVDPDTLPGLSDDENLLIKKYRELDAHGRELADFIITKEYERSYTAVVIQPATVYQSGAFRWHNDTMRGALHQPQIATDRRKLLLYDLPVSAGPGAYLDSDTARTIDVNLNVVTEQADFALRVSGNSMEPRYFDGDIVLVSEQPSVEVGELGIFIADGEGFFKKYGGDRLISLNPAYKDIPLDKVTNIVCCGKVIGRIKKTV